MSPLDDKTRRCSLLPLASLSEQSLQAEEYDLEELLEKLDFAVVTAREALVRAAMPGESLN
jgi:hypothetical protein